MKDTMQLVKKLGYEVVLNNHPHYQFYNEEKELYVFIDVEKFTIKFWSLDVLGQIPVNVDVTDMQAFVSIALLLQD